MTDIVEQLRAKADWQAREAASLRRHSNSPSMPELAEMHEESGACMLEAADEITRLRSGLMKSVQYDNKCDQTGRSCREDGPCGCQKEAETWLE